MQNTEKLSITLPVEMVRLIRDKVSGGGYSSNSEVIREAMRGWMSKEQRLAALDAAIEKGIASTDAGRVQSVEAVRAELRERIEA
jgi:antitoxin ParD1/3/4